MSRRSLFRFDYRIYSETGRKVPIKTCSGEMENKSLKVKQKQIKQELNTVFQTYTLDELDQAEVLEFLGLLRDLGQQYRSIHAELEVELGDQYLESYPDSETFCKRLVDSTRQANARLKQLIEQNHLKTENDQIEKAKNRLRVREQVFQQKLSRSSENFETEDVDGIRESCQYFNNLSEEFYDIFHEVKIVYGEEYQDDFGDRFETTFTKITDVIKLGRDKIKKLHAEKEATALAERDKAGDVAKKNHIKDQEVLADVLLNEIKLRQNALSTKCDTTILDSMSDHQILSFQKMMCEIDSELRELMREVTRYSNILVSCGGDVTEKLVAPRKIQNECVG